MNTHRRTHHGHTPRASVPKPINLKPQPSPSTNKRSSGRTASPGRPAVVPRSPRLPSSNPPSQRQPAKSITMPAEGDAKRWLALESNPDVMTTYLEKLGLDASIFRSVRSTSACACACAELPSRKPTWTPFPRTHNAQLPRRAVDRGLGPLHGRAARAGRSLPLPGKGGVRGAPLGGGGAGAGGGANRQPDGLLHGARDRERLRDGASI